MIKEWVTTASEILGNFRIFKIRRDTSLSPRTGESHQFFVLQAPDWINIIPLTAEGAVILVHQFRHGNKEITLEIPGGMVDDGETPLDAAAREMLEETGYAAEEIISLGSVAPNPAFLDNRCYSFLARNVRQIAEPALDGAEDIEIMEVPLEAIPGMIVRGEITHSLPITAFYLFEQYRQQNHG